MVCGRASDDGIFMHLQLGEHPIYFLLGRKMSQMQNVSDGVESLESVYSHEPPQDPTSFWVSFFFFCLFEQL